MRKLHWIGLLILLSGVGSVNAQTPERFSLSGPKVAVFNIAGEMRVEAGSGSAVIVEVLRGGDDADQLAVRTSDMADWRALRIIYPSNRIVYPRLGRFNRSNFDVNDDGTFGGRAMRATLTEEGFNVPSGFRMNGDQVRVTGSGSGLEAYADVRVLVPAGVTVALQLGVGKVNVSNVDGHVRVEARSGSVSATGVQGSLLIETGSGSVTASDVVGHTRILTGSGGISVGDVSKGTLEIDTGSGSIDGSLLKVIALDAATGSGGIQLRDVDAPELRLDTGSGSIRAEAVRARDLGVSTGSGSITLDLLSDVRNASINTGSGGVSVGIPPQLGAELIVDTGSGGIDSSIPLQVTLKKRSSLRGRIGDGNGRIQIDTGSGGVRLRGN
jgi:lia operon protein LiaG